MIRTRLARPLVGALLAALFASPALAAPKMEIAVQDDAALVTRPRGDGLRTLAFQRAAQLGARHIRVNAWFKRKLDGTIDHDFRALDSFVDEARLRGFAVQMTVGAVAADWGSPDPARVAPAGVTPRLSEYLAFLEQVVRHFKGRVRRFSLWNEPNHPAFLLAGPPGAVATYRKLLAAQDSRGARRIFHRVIFDENVKFVRALWHEGVKVVRRVDPEAQVLVGELSSFQALSFADRVLRHGATVVADGIAVHPYQYKTSPESSSGLASTSGGIANAPKLQNLLAHLAKTGRFVNPKGKAVPLFYTEFGYHRLEGRTIAQPDRQIPEALRAQWAPRAFAVARRAHARQMLYYELLPPWSGHPWDTSLLDPNGNPDASFLALADWVAKHDR